MSSLGDIFGQLQATIGVVFEQLASNVVGSLQATLAGLLTSLGGKRNAQLFQIAQTYLPLVQQLFSNGSFSINQILSQFEGQIQQFLGSLGQPQARSAFLAAAQQTKGEITDAFNSLLNEALGHLTNIATSLANAGLASLLTALSGKRGLLDSFTDILSGLASTLNGHINNITTTVVDLGTQLWGSVTPTLQDLQDQLTNHALNAGQSLLDSLASISQTLQG